jgi:hypothetical protein
MNLHTLPPDHNDTTRRFPRSRMDAWQSDFAACIEQPERVPLMPLALLAPIVCTVLALALLYVVQQRADERKAAVAACEALQEAERASPAACRSLHLSYTH